ncbi:MAG: carbon monoxide dehydrogenase [marine actinobacterium MedAcidi-G2A]|nr:MAG: carbon monoxide dehydrogenase [marine actinobacterium MedAcidi-G2A]MBA4809557.1 xanthine dehydrogenase subunit D [Acidimicrobiales bacterium]|tara:strand:+ start:1609 stop:3858 length:2250 start_codon:yes stop_codon:yes gene_type:complete
MSIVEKGLASSAGVGVSAARPDGKEKVKGNFLFSNDLSSEDMLWGQTLRSPHASAKIKGIDFSHALTIEGVHAVLTADDVPGENIFGLEHPDQPVLAFDAVRYVGEPVAIIAANHPEVAKQAADSIVVDYEVLNPLVDSRKAIEANPIHPDGNIIRHLTIKHGDPDASGDFIVEGEYEVGMQDQAFLGTESGIAFPASDGSIDLHISTQWLHSDKEQVASALNLPEELVRVTLAGVGGAFGGREDVSMHVHLCMLALHTGRPVKMIYDRNESFLGHVHRHPAKLWFRHHADESGKLVKVEAKVILDGGAYASTTSAVLANACCFSVGPYNVPNALIEGWGVRTNNPPCGAMRGFGNVQTCFGAEAQMDKLAKALSLDPVEFRLLNALKTSDILITGQEITGTAPVKEVLTSLAKYPLPKPSESELLDLPGGTGRTTDKSHVKRGIGYAASIKNLMFSEGFDDFSEARCIISDGEVLIKSACVEVGQGFVTLVTQIVEETLGISDVTILPVDTSIGSAGSTSASRQTWMSGGAVLKACEAVVNALILDLSSENGVTYDKSGLNLVSQDGSHSIDIATALRARNYDEHITYRHKPTFPLDHNGQGNAHVSFAFAAHRAVVDVDVELGLVRVVEIATSQDVGRILNPVQARGQIEGGIAQGLGLALLEELVLNNGKIANANFTDYLLPTAMDTPPIKIASLIEQPEPGAPFGAKGIGEPPVISSTPAIISAIRNATGKKLNRVPIKPEDIVF